jgi:tetratricopeptide (TPR) repeat protein
MDYQLYNQIHVLIERDKFDLALEKIAIGLAEYPDSDDLYSLQATAYLKQKKYKEAQQAINTAISLNPENDYLYYTNARLAVAENNYKNAEKYTDEAIALNPYEAGYFGLKAAIYIDQHKYIQAVDSAEQGLEIDPENLMCNNMLSMAQTKSGNADEAFNRLENMLADDPENELTQANTGYYYLRMGNAKKAKEHFAVALHSDPEYEFARAGMVQAIKATNFIYAGLLRFSYWMQEMSSKYRIGVYIGIILIVKVIPILLPFYLILVLWTWFTNPLSDILLYFDKYGRYLMTALDRVLVRVNIGILVLALLTVAAGIWLESSFFLLAFGLVLSIIPVAMIDPSAKKLKQVVVWSFALLFPAIGLFGLYQTYVMNSDAAFAGGLLILAAVVFSWLIVAVRR